MRSLRLRRKHSCRNADHRALHLGGRVMCDSVWFAIKNALEARALRSIPSPYGRQSLAGPLVGTAA